MAAGNKTIQDIFTLFAKFGNSKSKGKTITLTQSDKWMKQAGVIDKNITTSDTGICFYKLKSKNLTFKDYDTFLQDLAKCKKLDYNEIVTKMRSCGTPSTTNATQVVRTAGVDRLTDTSKYTGTQKYKYDESVKLKAKKGRVDDMETSEYIPRYSSKDAIKLTNKTK